MIKKTALIALCVMVAMVAYAEPEPVEEPQGPAWVEFESGKYLIAPADPNSGNPQDNVLVIIPSEPLMKDRFSQYGMLVTNPKTGEIGFDTKAKDRVTEKGLEIHNLLIRMETMDHWFAYAVVKLDYGRVTCIKYSRTSWDEILEKTLAAFK